MLVKSPIIAARMCFYECLYLNRFWVDVHGLELFEVLVKGGSNRFSRFKSATRQQRIGKNVADCSLGYQSVGPVLGGHLHVRSQSALVSVLEGENRKNLRNTVPIQPAEAILRVPAQNAPHAVGPNCGPRIHFQWAPWR